MIVKPSRFSIQTLQSILSALMGHKLFGSGLISLIIKVSGAGLGYIMFVALAHLLPPEQYGAFAFSFNLAVVVSAVIGFGFPTGIMRYWSKYMAQNSQSLARGTMKMGWSLTLIGCAFAGIIGVILDFTINPESFALRSFVSVSALAIATCLADFAAGALRAQNSVLGAMLPRDILWRLLVPVLAFLLMLSGFPLDGIKIVYLCAGTLILLVLPQIILIARGVIAAAGSNITKMDWAEPRKTLPPIWAASIVYAMIQQMDVVVVGYLMNGADTGAYFAAQKTAMLLSLVLIAGGLATAPTMAALFEQKKTAELQKLCRQMAIVISVVTFLGLVFLALTGNLLLSLFNTKFISAYPILIILAFGCMIDAMSGPTSYLMQMTSLQSVYAKMLAIIYALVFTLQLIFVPHYGILAAALANATGVIVWNCFSIYFIRSKIGVDPSILGLIYPPKARHS